MCCIHFTAISHDIKVALHGHKFTIHNLLGFLWDIKYSRWITTVWVWVENQEQRTKIQKPKLLLSRSEMNSLANRWAWIHCIKCVHVCVSAPVEHIQLLAPFVVIKNKEVNLTAVVWPSCARTLTYFWWLGNNTEVQSAPS